MHAIEEKIGYVFQDKELLTVALTHSSHSLNHVNNERLEFLGDAVLELIISEYLFTHEKRSEGEMTRMRANIVCAESLSRAAMDLDLGEFILLGKGEIVTGGRKRRSNLANAFEAVMGAVFLDSCYETTRQVVLNALNKNIGLALAGRLIKDYKTELQEQIQKQGENAIEYVLEKADGPEHSKTFYVDLVVNGQMMSQGSGKSKKEAEQNAAKNYLFKEN